jgi:hypothetical protein
MRGCCLIGLPVSGWIRIRSGHIHCVEPKQPLSTGAQATYEQRSSYWATPRSRALFAIWESRSTTRSQQRNKSTSELPGQSGQTPPCSDSQLLGHLRTLSFHSITSSAMLSMSAEMVSPSFFAVLRLMHISDLLARRQIGGLIALENPCDIEAGLPVEIELVGPVAY